MHLPEDVADEAPPIGRPSAIRLACLFGLFVLFFVWTVAIETSLAADLKTERASRAAETARLAALESALAGPLASGRITLVDGRIGIRGSVLFDLTSAELRDEGRAVLHDIAAPLRAYLAERGELLMVSGFTDDRPIRGPSVFRDNWELSVQRALTVTRALEANGMPHDGVRGLRRQSPHRLQRDGRRPRAEPARRDRPRPAPPGGRP